MEGGEIGHGCAWCAFESINYEIHRIWMSSDSLINILADKFPSTHM